jgi:hypothetical protein
MTSPRSIQSVVRGTVAGDALTGDIRKMPAIN